MVNLFTNDSAHLSMEWLLQLMRNRGLEPRHIYRVLHMNSSSIHYLAILPDQRYICDCCMGVNLGIPCRHFLRVWTDARNLNRPKFHMGLIRARWYKNPKLDIKTLPSSTFDHAGPRIDQISTTPSNIPTSLLSNPIDRVPTQSETPPPTTRTVGARQVNHEANAALRPLLAGVQTEEELTEIVEELRALR
ncbi:hypothetical protein FA15DRAFT_601867 [Coprinopsis marcescibilis]|uniref:SWIM-type domain-containing protein n=1 Tax=Coprinopsis marcescibilis TaxID=230819 RepID=A0A5C3KTV2_COPMA|nr:hypothetical protein FA15DRAFT_601867 [Coprinopsis marcescibilis]